MARRVSLHDVKTAIRTIEEDGGVILTGFSTVADVEQVNKDALPYISAIKANVCIHKYTPPTLPVLPTDSWPLIPWKTKQLTCG